MSPFEYTEGTRIIDCGNRGTITDEDEDYEPVLPTFVWIMGMTAWLLVAEVVRLVVESTQSGGAIPL